MATVLDRLKLFISTLEMTPRAFAIKIDFNYSTLNNYLTGRRTTIDLELISRTISSFENLSAEWLMRGKGEMLLTSEQPTGAEDRMNKLIDTITFQQDTIKNYKNLITDLENKNKLLEAELTIFKNNKLIG
jgi:hypothetical protein